MLDRGSQFQCGWGSFILERLHFSNTFSIFSKQ
jgi:hypothetical protein